MKRRYLQFLFCLLFPALTLAQGAPTRVSLVDTGYDICLQMKADACEQNRNLLFRGDQPLDDANEYRYDAETFRNIVFSYIQQFKQVYSSSVTLPKSAAELKNYRIVIINLLYDGTSEGSVEEFTELTKEFSFSGANEALHVPEQHKLYGLEDQFNPSQFAFEWWPISLFGKSNPENSDINLNWPNHEKVLVWRTNQFFKPMDFSYLITGVPYGNEVEKDAFDLVSLLTLQPKDNHPLLIFYHCVAGKDRTGAVTMSYFMKHGGYANIVDPSVIKDGESQRSSPMSFMQAWTATTNTHYPHPKEESLLTAQAYCMTLGKKSAECAI